LIVAFNLLLLSLVKHQVAPMVSEKEKYLTKEQQLIALVQSKVGNRYVGDDCARLPGNLLVTSDTLVERTHFILVKEEARLKDLGWKSMAVSLSDIAAMAGVPRYALIAITMPENLSRQHFAYLYQGLIDCSKRYKTDIVGGDITKGTVLSITITVIGEANERGCLLRGGAKPGDVVVVTGDFGASKAGLKMLLDDKSLKQIQGNIAVDDIDGHHFSNCLASHNRPLPRLEESWALVNETGSRGALMDASDGLADALAQISRASEVGMTIDLQKVPIKGETAVVAKMYGEAPLDWALYGGEDYQLVACLPEKTWQTWLNRNKDKAIPFQAIGRATSSGKVELMLGNEQGPELDLRRCFQHIA